MDGDISIIRDLQRINAGLTQSLCEHQALVGKLNRQIFYAREDLKAKDEQLAAKDLMLQQLQLQQQPQWPIHAAPNAPFQSVAALPSQAFPPQQPITLDNRFMEHRMAGTLLSPGKKSRRPLASLNDNKPLKLSDLPNRNASKRAPLHSPPAKPVQKKPSHRPTPEKLSMGRGDEHSIDADEQQRRKQQSSTTAMSLTELRTAKWTVSNKALKPAACRPLLTAIYRVTNGDVSMLQSSIDWLSKSVPACRAVQQTPDVEAANIVANINSWLEHNLNNRWKKGGTLPIEIDQALQAVCSAALFNRSKMNVEQVRRVLPSVGRARMDRTKEFNSKLIDEEKRFFWPSRKVRKDAMWPLLCLFVRRKICWNDKYTKVDTNYSRKIKCKEPIIESMDGGGFRLTGWKVVEREMRMWYEETKLADVLKLVESSDEWKQLKIEYPSISMSSASLRLALCPSVRKPSFRSCVNEKMSALSYLMEDFHCVLKNNNILRKRIDECQCRRHRTAREMIALDCSPPPLWHEELRCLPSKFCGMATCAKKEQPYLRVGNNNEPPKLRDKRCTKSACPDCGFEKKLGLGDAECTAFKDCSELMEVTLWEKAARNGDRFQREPTRYTGDDRKTVAEVYSILVDEVAPVALEHLGEAQWWHAHVERKVSTFDSNEIVIYTDFSATPELIAKEVGNCHEAEHCVIDVLVVLDDPRMIEVVSDGETTVKRINSCTYWAFLGPTDGKGKKNDHRFHREALHSVVDFHKKKALQRSIQITTVTMLTDNCGGQYKSQYNMGDVAWFAERQPGIRLEHGYATVFEFKGVHDGFGKTVKWKFKEAELKGRRIPSAQEGYGYLLNQYAGCRTDWIALEEEGSPKLLQRGSFTMTEVRVGFIGSKEEADSVLQKFGGDHVLHCDRDSVPRTVGDKAAEGLTDVYSIRGKRESVLADKDQNFWELELSARVCFCSVCTTRDSHEQTCPYSDVRNVRRITVDDKATDDTWCKEQRAKRAIAIHFRKKNETGYINMDRLRNELRLLGKQFPDNVKRMDLAFIFLSMQESSGSEQQQLVFALEDEIQNPEQPSVDDDIIVDTGNERELPLSEEEAPTNVDQLIMNDIEEEGAGNDYNISDKELKLLPDLSSLTDTVLRFLLSHRRLSTAGSRAEQEERLTEAIRPF